MKCFFTFLLSVPFVFLHAQPGTLDKTYGTAKTGTVSVYNQLNTSAAAMQPDDKLILGGYDSTLGQDHIFILVRHNKDGSLDTSFGIKGQIVTSVDDLVKSAQRSLGWTSVAVQPDGKIVAAGNIGWNNPDYPDAYPVLYDVDIVVARFLPDGTPDKSFGTAGRVVSNFDYLENITAVAIQADGKVVVAGYQTTDIYNNSNGFLVVRYNKNGSLDSSFGNNEGYSLYYNIGGTYGYALLLQPDGKMVVGGAGLPSDFFVARYLTNGLLDDSFGNKGTVRTNFSNGQSEISITSLALDGRGRIAAVGNLNFDKHVEVVRYLPDGSLDNSFDKDGKLELSYNDISYRSVSGFAVLAQPENKLIVSSLIFGDTDTIFKLTVTGINEDGTIDPSFGTDEGQTITNIGLSNYLPSLNAVAQSDGKIIISGDIPVLQEGNIYTNTYSLTRFSGYPTKVPLAIRVKRFLLNHGISWKGLPAEDEIAYYAVEQSSNSTSGFVPVAKVSGAASLKNYNITNNRLLEGINFYRIKAVSTDGTIRYSETVSADNTANTASVFPNPARSYVTVQGLPTSETADISISDGSGNVKARGISSGSAQYRSSLNNLQPGTYYVNITTKEKTETLKFVKE